MNEDKMSKRTHPMAKWMFFEMLIEYPIPQRPVGTGEKPGYGVHSALETGAVSGQSPSDLWVHVPCQLVSPGGSFSELPACQEPPSLPSCFPPAWNCHSRPTAATQSPNQGLWWSRWVGGGNRDPENAPPQLLCAPYLNLTGDQ